MKNKKRILVISLVAIFVLVAVFGGIEVYKYNTMKYRLLISRSSDNRIEQPGLTYGANSNFGMSKKAMEKGAMFDSRCFNIPKEDVCNCLIWRQQDATRNSIESVGQAYFSHNELKYKKCDVVQDMLFIEFGVNWNNYSSIPLCSSKHTGMLGSLWKHW